MSVIKDYLFLVKNGKKFFHVVIKKGSAIDTGMAMVLLLLSLALLLSNMIFLKIAIATLIITMIVPKLFYPLAYLWLGIAHIIGTIISRVLLFLVFVLVVLPVGMLRKSYGRDVLLLNKWKQSNDSVFKIRNHIYTASDIEKPY